MVGGCDADSFVKKKMKQTALITGASGGIGLEMAKQMAANNYHLVLCARSTGKLVALQQEITNTYPVSVVIITKDLSDVKQAKELYQEVKAMGINITALINNAGVGNYGPFTDSNIDEDIAMMELNMTSLMVLTRLFVTDMKAANYGKIMNVASLLSFFPYPNLSVYAASKAFVLHFTEGISAELKGTNVTATAICPGPAKSDFGNDALYQSNAYKMLPLVKPVDIARKGVKQFLKGKRIVITDLPINIIIFITKISPRSINLMVTRFLGNQ